MNGLVQPDRLDQSKPSLGSVFDEVSDEDEGDPSNGCSGSWHSQKQSKWSGVGTDVVGEHLPVFPLVHCHPVGLKGKVADEVERKEQNERIHGVSMV